MLQKIWYRPRFHSHEVPWKFRVFIGLLFLTFVFYCILVYTVTARDLDGRYAQIDPMLKQWFNEQKVPDGPGKGMSCCSLSDGVTAEEDYRKGKYWARFFITVLVTKEEISIPWTEVPDSAVLKGPFPASVGQPIVWWAATWDDSQTGKIKKDEGGKFMVHVICFKPGAGT